MEKAKNIIDKLLSVICMILMAVITALVTYQVVVRYFLKKPNQYTEALAKYMFVWMVLYASAYVFGLREHMNIGFVRERFSDRTRIIIEMIGEFVVALFASFVMIYGGYKQVIDQMVQLDAALQIPMGYIYSAVPISGLFIVFYFFYNEKKLIEEFKSVKR